MLAKRYIAKDEFELYGVLSRELCWRDFPKRAVKALCFRREADESWLIFETLETSVEKTCGDFVCKHRPKDFVVTLDATKAIFEVCFQGPAMCLFAKFDGRRLSVLEFDDKNPNDTFKDFAKKELKDSVVVLKKILKD
jgi:hypothetical protein